MTKIEEIARLLEPVAWAALDEYVRVRELSESEVREKIAERPDGLIAQSLSKALTALQALREPTKGMWEAGTDAIEEKRDYSRDTDGSYECTRPSDQAIPCWQAMIDHLIQEGKE